HLLFFGNYFIGFLAVALSIEGTMQQKLPFNSLNYYLLLFLAPTIYYTYAYNKATTKPANVNPRSQWYYENKNFINKSQAVLIVLCLLLGGRLLYFNYNGILNLPILYWISIGTIVIAAILYYGLLPKSFLKFNLRNTGWFKAIIIGFVWACFANVLPLIMLKIETGATNHDAIFWIWLFIKNFMFCTVNAIIFDIKDYPTDANKQLRTVVVNLGLRRTIFYIVLPLVTTGMIAFLIAATYKNFGLIPIFINLIPFVLTLIVSYSMLKRKNILYYLIIIDGLIFVKAICGIIGALFIK
ncbi:MAG: hypothetical protein ABI554_08770, partial [Flavobacterium sp.]